MGTTRAGWPGSRPGWADDAARADAAQAVTALYEAHAAGLIRLAVVMLGDRALHGLYPEGNQDVLWTNASGSTLIVVDRQPGLKHVSVSGGDMAYWRPVISVLTPGRFARIPGAPSPQSPHRWPAW